MAVGSREQVPVEALVRFGRFLLVQRAQAEFKVTAVVGRQLDADLHVRVGPVALHDDALAVRPSVLVRARLLRFNHLSNCGSTDDIANPNNADPDFVH